ncbi:MAG: serine/threonine-protein kinase [Planctomycetota bacterium]
MKPRTEEAIFCEAVALPESRRADFVREMCANNEELTASIFELLRIHETDNDFLEKPAHGVAAIGLSEQSGDRIGSYRLVEKIGEGGFGVVWKALQLEPLKRNVALKIVKLGMDPDSIIRRFDEERQTLAIMSHPGIAAVLDAGTTESGRPFFAMELVEGVPIDQYCADHRLTIEQRLPIFIAVCRAVQHAHQKGIVHRDLKPSNILVSSIGDDVIPKVIDFGIAKAMTSQPHNSCGDAALIGTPSFMSPEQLRNEPDVDTRSDIYSLGVILNRLLTGESPEMPLEDGTTDIRADQHQIDKEPGWIASKAMSRDRDKRYESASGFARDIERFLGQEPVLAGPQTGAYRWKKFCQRNRALVTAACVVLLAIAGGVAALVYGLSNANHQREIAEAQTQLAQAERMKADRQKTIAEDEAEEARIVASFLESVVGGANPSTGNSLEYSLREHLDEVAASLDQLADHPVVEAELRMTIASALHNLSRIVDAEVHYEKALMLRRSELGEEDTKTLESRIGYASCLSRLARFDEAEEQITAVVALVSETRQPDVYLEALRVLKFIRTRQQRHEEAFEISGQSLQLARTVHGDEHPFTVDVLGFYSSTANALGRFDEAEQAARQALDILVRLYPDKQFTLANAEFRLALVLVNLGKFDEAGELVSSVITRQTAILGENDEHVIRGLCAMANIHWESGDSLEAEQFARDAVGRAMSLPESQLGIRATAYRRLAVILQEDQPEESAEAWEQSIAFRYQLLGHHPQVTSHLQKLARLYSRLERLDEAAACFERVIGMLEQMENVEPQLKSAYEQYSELLDQMGRTELAEEYRQVLEELSYNSDREE